MDPNGQLANALHYVDIVTTILFTIESLVKIISFGLVINNDSSYLRNPWNLMDFLIVVFSIISLTIQDEKLKVFKVFRLIRVLRPLRVIARNEGLKVAVQALLMATPNIANVTIISLLFFLIFGIIGVNYFKGTYYECVIHELAKTEAFTSITDNIFSKWDCLNAGGVWSTRKYHFDHIFASMVTLFHMSTVVGWAEVMYLGMSTTKPNYTFEYKNRPLWAFFFIAFIIIGAFFILNLFVGVVISTFNREKESLGKNFLLTEK